jgi:hypothetical protein
VLNRAEFRERTGVARYRQYPWREGLEIQAQLQDGHQDQLPESILVQLAGVVAAGGVVTLMYRLGSDWFGILFCETGEEARAVGRMKEIGEVAREMVEHLPEDEDGLE